MGFTRAGRWRRLGSLLAGLTVGGLAAAALGAHGTTVAQAERASSEMSNAPGGAIAFVRGDEHGRLLFSIRANGSGLRRLAVNRSGSDEDPAWSPDGRRIAFARSLDDGRTFRIWLVGVDGRGLRPVSPRGGRFAMAPTWSHDGSRIAFVGSGGVFGECKGDLFTVRPDGSGLRRLARNAESPAWSPDGTRLAVVRPDSREQPRILVGTASGTRLRPVAYGAHPTWSPDGRRIAFARVQRGVTRVFVMYADGHGSRGLSRSHEYQLDPAWSPDGRWIAYWSARTGGQNVYVSPVAGGRAVRLTRPPARAGDREPAWRPTAGRG